jgi:hypothetical protein
VRVAEREDGKRSLVPDADEWYGVRTPSARTVMIQ